MKSALFKIALLSAMVFLLCSFSSPNGTENDNTYLQNVVSFDDYEAEFESKSDEELGRVYDGFLSLLPDGIASLTNRETDSFEIESIVGFVKDLMFDEDSELVKNSLRFIAIGMIFALSEILTLDMGDIAASVKSAVAICLSLPVLVFAKDVISSVESGICSGSEFFSGVVPLACSVIAIGNGAATASASAAGMSVSLSFVSGFLSKNLFPISILIFSVSLISTYDTEGAISTASRGVRNWFNFAVGTVSLIIVATLSFQTVISASVDSIAMRGARYAVSNMIPVVGNVISGALSTLTAGVKMLSSTMGALSVATLLYFMGAPLVSLLIYRFCMGLCITFCSLTGASFGQKFFESVRGAFDCMIGILVFSLLIYILDLAVFMKVVSGIV